MRASAGPSWRVPRGPVFLATAGVAVAGVLALAGFTTYRQLVLAPPADCRLARHTIETGAALSPNYPAHAELWARARTNDAARIQDDGLRRQVIRYVDHAALLVTGPQRLSPFQAWERQVDLSARIRDRCPGVRVVFPSPTGNSPR